MWVGIQIFRGKPVSFQRQIEMKPIWIWKTNRIQTGPKKNKIPNILANLFSWRFRNDKSIIVEGVLQINQASAPSLSPQQPTTFTLQSTNTFWNSVLAVLSVVATVYEEEDQKMNSIYLLICSAGDFAMIDRSLLKVFSKFIRLAFRSSFFLRRLAFYV